MIFLSGPCVIESQDQLDRIATDLRSVSEMSGVDFYYKASFDKANRTSLESYRGPGLDAGMDMLMNIKKKFGYRIITDVHEICQVDKVSRVADVIQIPAFLCRQTDLVVEVAKTGCIINIKKGQFVSPTDMRHIVLKAIKTRDPRSSNASLEVSRELGVWITERGSTFGYGNLVVDMRSLYIMREFAPVIFDATHSVQIPGGLDGKSGGDSRFVAVLARAAAAVGVDGFFMETHYDPVSALSDGPNMIKTSDVYGLVSKLISIGSVSA